MTCKQCGLEKVRDARQEVKRILRTVSDASGRLFSLDRHLDQALDWMEQLSLPDFRGQTALQRGDKDILRAGQDISKAKAGIGAARNHLTVAKMRLERVR